MTTSGNKEFNPLVRELVDEAYEQCGLDPQDLEDRALRSARRSLNQLLSGYIGRTTPLWLIKPVSFRAGGSDIPASPENANIAWVEQDPDLAIGRASGYIQFPLGTNQINALSIRLEIGGYPVPLASMTAEDWNNYPTRDSGAIQRGQPYWFYWRRVEPPRAYLVYQPDTTYTFDATLVQEPDAVLTSNETVNIPRRWQEAISSGLAYKLALKVAPDRVALLKPIYDEALKYALEGEDDGVALTVDHGVF